MKQTERLLNALKTKPMTNTEIIDYLRIFNYTGRISDLRKQGYTIVAKKLQKGLWQYKLEEEGEPCQK